MSWDVNASKAVIWLCLVTAALCAMPAGGNRNEETTREILAIEHQVLDGWQAGDPDPALTVSDPGITYFHVVTSKRLDGLVSFVKGALRGVSRQTPV